MTVKFKPVHGVDGRLWRSECEEWEVVQLRHTCFRLMHLPLKRMRAGDYSTLKEAQEVAGKIQKLLLEEGK